MSLPRKIVYKAYQVLSRQEIKAFEHGSCNLQVTQLNKLKQILSLNSKTTFGHKHVLNKVKSPQDFQLAVNVSDYEYYRPYIKQMLDGEQSVLTSEEPFMFATTSGTSGDPKYVPVTKSYIKEFRHASIASGYFMLKNFPKINSGVILSMFSPAQEGLSPGGIPYGAISGELYLQEPTLVKKLISPIPYSCYQIKDYESRYYAILRAALSLPVSCIYTLNPSTIVMLIKKLEYYSEKLINDIACGTCSCPQELDKSTLESLSPFLKPDLERANTLYTLLNEGKFLPYAIWPHLQVICCWTKAAAAFYLEDFPKYFGNIPICDITYGASEGRGSISLGDGRQVLAFRSHFFEFIPEEEIKREKPTILLAHELSQNKNYYILFTTAAGLYRYHINDVIKVTGFYNQAPLIEFQYKGGNIFSFTGEKITELQVTQAMGQALAEHEISCQYFTALPEFKPNPHYHILFEPNTTNTTPINTHNLSQFIKNFDKHLGLLNIEYRAKRESGRLEPATISLLACGTYEDLRKTLSSCGVADAQIKLSHLNPKPQIREYLLPRCVNLPTN